MWLSSKFAIVFKNYELLCIHSLFLIILLVENISLLVPVEWDQDLLQTTFLFQTIQMNWIDIHIEMDPDESPDQIMDNDDDQLGKIRFVPCVITKVIF